MEEVVQIKGVVRRLIFSGYDNYRVYRVTSSRKTFSLVGISSMPLSPGDRIIAQGQWGEYRGQITFKASALMQEMPKETSAIIAWLKSRSVKGVGERTIEKIAEFFGEKLPEVIDDAERLMAASISRERAEAISAAWKEKDLHAEVMMYLSKLGLGASLIEKLIEHYGPNIKHILEFNPWQIAEAPGVGFKSADAVALSLGWKPDCAERVEAALSHVLNERAHSYGHCGLPKDRLVWQTRNLLSCPRPMVEECLERNLVSGALCYDEQVSLVYTPRLLQAEKLIADLVVSGQESNGLFNSRSHAEAHVTMAQNDLGVNLDEHQKKAVTDALLYRLCVITGGPGTGKSTTMRVLAHALSMVGITAALCAPTGRAAKRLSETTGRSARTIHRLLVWDPIQKGFRHNASNPLKSSWIILDEFSMVGTTLFADLCIALKKECSLTLVGDADQLPSVDPGKVLSDIIQSGVVHVARLIKTHRQGKGSGIAYAAQRINQRRMPLEEGVMSHNGFHLEYFDEPEDRLVRALELISYELPLHGYDPLYDMQILIPMRAGLLGTENVNAAVKSVLNPYREDGRSVIIKGRAFTVGDRVMHLRNDYQKAVFNGESGIVAEVIPDYEVAANGKPEAAVRVDYSGWEAIYTKKDIKDIDYCWAVTVHKSQGSEYPVVIYLYDKAHRSMLNKNIAYTAVTRAKQECWMIGTQDMLAFTVSQEDQNERMTGLSKRLNNNIVLPHQRVREMPSINANPFALKKSPAALSQPQAAHA